MKFLLDVKHWFIFFCAFIVPALVILYGYYQVKVDVKNMTLWLYLIPIGIAIMQMVIYGWLWVVGSKLTDIVPVDSSKVAAYKGIIIVPFFTLVAILAFWVIIPFMFPLSKLSSADMMVLFTTGAVVIQGFFIISFLYCFYLLSILLKQNEVMDYVDFKECFKEFFLILFLPVGIWFLQPVINKTLGKANTDLYRW